MIQLHISSIIWFVILGVHFAIFRLTRKKSFKGLKKSVMRSAASWRYKTGFYHFPYEIKAMHKIWKYRQPEIEGFYGE
jgi:hypothetical protein